MCVYTTGLSAWQGITFQIWAGRRTANISQIVDFVRRWSGKTEIGAGRFILWLDITATDYFRLADKPPGMLSMSAKT